jgi:hypothetical protein
MPDYTGFVYLKSYRIMPDHGRGERVPTPYHPVIRCVHAVGWMTNT